MTYAITERTETGHAHHVGNRATLPAALRLATQHQDDTKRPCFITYQEPNAWKTTKQTPNNFCQSEPTTEEDCIL